MFSKHPHILLLMSVSLLLTHSAHSGAASPALKTSAAPTGVEPSTLLEPQADAWRTAAAQPVMLSQSPPLYDGDPSDDGMRPATTIKAFRFPDNTVVLRCHWSDATEDIAHPGERFPDAGQQHVYVEHSAATDRFPDAFCVMLPQERGARKSYPPLMMGDTQNPADLYLWRAGKGFEPLKSHGRGTTGPAGGAEAAPPAVQGRFQREDNGWTVVMAIPNAAPQSPVCFAVWDGAKLHRDGLKYFSLWYELE